MMRKNSIMIPVFCWTMVFTFCFSKCGEAQDVTYVPSFTVSGEYNDNLLFDREDKRDDFITNYKPEFRFEYETELLQMVSRAAVTFSRYDTETSLNQEDHLYSLNGSYRLTERCTMSGKLAYVKDTTLESEPTDSVVSEIEETEAVYFRTDRDRYNVKWGLNYRLTELSALSVDYDYSKAEYDFEDNTDYYRNLISLSYRRRLKSQVDNIATTFSYERRDSETSDVDNYNLSFYWDYIFSETLKLETSLGVRYTQEHFADNTPTKDTWRGTADIRMTKKADELSSATVGYRRDLRTSSTGKAVNVDKVYCSLRKRLFGKLNAGLSGSLYFTREDNESLEEDNRYFFEVTPSLSYRLTENHSLKLAYSYSWDYDNSLDKDREIERSRVWLILSFNFPGKW